MQKNQQQNSIKHLPTEITLIIYTYNKPAATFSIKSIFTIVFDVQSKSRGRFIVFVIFYRSIRAETMARSIGEIMGEMVVNEKLQRSLYVHLFCLRIFT